MNILITGATGYVGRHLLPLLNKNKLYLVVRDKQKAEALFGKDPIYISSSNLSELDGCKIDIVIHLAALVTSRNDSDIVKPIVDTNILFGVQLLDTIHNYLNPRLFINIGTFAEYRNGPMQIDNAYLYSATKTAFKELLKYYSSLDRYKYVHVIPYTIYGGGKDSQKKVIDFIKSSIESDKPVKMSGGEQILDFINVEDVADFLLYIINNESKVIASDQTDYYLGTGKGTSIKDLAHKIEEKYDAHCNIDWGSLSYRERDVMYAVAPIQPLLNIGWRSKKELEDEL